jgi:XTP/dITP diphosphohydrolase
MFIDGMQLLVATKNAGKIKELSQLLAELPVKLRSLNEFPNVVEAEETGATFAENAALKAQSYALQTGFWALADDSGLEVEALRGAPGVFSARYAGENATDEEKIVKLLQELNATQDNQRRARFVCAMAISDEKGEIKFLTDGVCGGKIALTTSGTNGFGYDPIFIPDGFEQTFGKLSGEIKRGISHRAKAAKKIIQYLRDFYVA